MQRRTFLKLTAALGVSLPFLSAKTLSNILEDVGILNTPRPMQGGRYALFAFKDRDLTRTIFYGVSVDCSRSTILKYGVFDSVSGLHWVKLPVVVNMIHRERYIPAGGICPVYMAHTVLMCENGQTVDIYKNKDLNFQVVPHPHVLHEDGAMLIPFTGAMSQRKTGWIEVI